LLQLRRPAEAPSGVRLHKQNFRRLVEQQGLVEETGGRPAPHALPARSPARTACACAPPAAPGV